MWLMFFCGSEAAGHRGFRRSQKCNLRLRGDGGKTPKAERAFRPGVLHASMQKPLDAKLGAVVIAVCVTPVPILLLFILFQFVEVTMPIAMGFPGPLVVKHDFMIVLGVIVAVVRIVEAMMVIAATNAGQ
jgi:hypothetical protein